MAADHDQPIQYHGLSEAHADLGGGIYTFATGETPVIEASGPTPTTETVDAAQEVGKRLTGAALLDSQARAARDERLESSLITGADAGKIPADDRARSLRGVQGARDELNSNQRRLPLIFND